MDLVLGVERFGEHYEAIGVFADDLLEMRSAAPVSRLQPLDPEGRRFRYTTEAGKAYVVEVFPDAGIVRLSRSTESAPSQESAPEASLAGPLAETAVAVALSKKGESASVAPVLGLLAGATLRGMSQPNAPRHIFTLRFDPSIGEWRAYDGGLVRWMKQELLPNVA
jgi:hypothetical protein